MIQRTARTRGNSIRKQLHQTVSCDPRVCLLRIGITQHFVVLADRSITIPNDHGLICRPNVFVHAIILAVQRPAVQPRGPRRHGSATWKARKQRFASAATAQLDGGLESRVTHRP